MVIDTFMWFDEVDVLELRLRLLDGLADVFVAVESDRTHSGLEKGWQLGEHRERLAAWWDRIVWVKMRGVPEDGPWEAENRQRRACRDAAADLQPHRDDVVVVSDVDEIWTADALEVWGSDLRVATQDFRLFSVYWRWPHLWPGSCGGPWWRIGNEDFQGLRTARYSMPPVRSGWHFSWMGDFDQMARKQRSFAHLELAGHDLEGPVAEGRWLDGTVLEETTEGLPDLTSAPPSWFRLRDGRLRSPGGP